MLTSKGEEFMRMRSSDYRDTHICPPCTKCKENDRIAPNPKVFNFVDATQVGEYLVAKILYPNCTNYEGIKILLYKTQLLDLVKQANIDPHFSNKKGYISPIARFEPTNDGWTMGLMLARQLAGQ